MNVDGLKLVLPEKIKLLVRSSTLWLLSIILTIIFYSILNLLIWRKKSNQTILLQRALMPPSLNTTTPTLIVPITNIQQKPIIIGALNHILYVMPIYPQLNPMIYLFLPILTTLTLHCFFHPLGNPSTWIFMHTTRIWYYTLYLTHQ